MTDFAQWQRNNERYLSAALAWVRLRLKRLAPQSAPTAAPPSPASEPTAPSFVERLRGRSAAEPVPDHPALPAPSPQAVRNQQIGQVKAVMLAAERIDPPPAALILSRRLGLSRFELQTLLLCAAMELDTRTAALCARAQDDPQRPYPTFALALALFDDPAWDALSPERPLRYWRLIEINQPGAQPLTSSALRADERIVSYIKGLNYLDDRLAPLLTPVETTDLALPPSQQQVVEFILHHWKQVATLQRLPVIQLTGMDGGSTRLIAGRVAAKVRLDLWRLPVDTLPTPVADLEALARLWQRESMLLPVGLYLDAHEIEPTPAEAAGGHAMALTHFLERSRGAIFLDTREAWPALEATATFDVGYITPAEQQAAWAAALGERAGDSPALMAGQFNFNVAMIQRIAQAALTDHRVNGPLHERLWASCRASTRPRLESLAQRLEPKATWDDIVLPGEAMDLLHQIADQVRRRMVVYDEWGFRAKMNRGLGISALFTGESGTGKTMAAEVLANDLKLDLYRIDLSAVVSKYIGETEKNLRKLFDAAEYGNAILFFDEADALFGKRSEVKDSHDRYANIEINYLLQRMESYRGLAILATNMKSALDTAFMRRLRFIVNFAFPGPVERKLIWQKVFPPQTPTVALDHDRLARLNLTGGSIHNIAVSAAFLAAAQQPPQVTMPLVLAAAGTEFRKLDRPISDAELR
jgi:hypothetical protein